MYSGTYKFGTYKTMHAVNCDSACSRERHAMSVILEMFDFATIVKVKIPSVEFVLSLELNFKRLQLLFAILTAD